MESARHPHTFLGIDAGRRRRPSIHTTGNPDGHVILRGGRTPNYDAESLRACEALLREGRPAAARAWSTAATRRPARTTPSSPRCSADLVRQVRAGGSPIMGFMLESNLGAGSQPLHGGREGLAYGVSITDACIDWPTTERCLLDAATALR